MRRVPVPEELPLLAPCVLFAAGIAVSRAFSIHSKECAVAAGVMAVLAAVAWWWGARRAAWWGAGALMMLSGVAIEVARRPGAAPVIDAAPRQTLVAEGCVVEPPAFFAEPPEPSASSTDDRPRERVRLRFTLELQPGARAQLTLYPRADEPIPTIRYGERIEVAARFRPIRNYRNPGEFDAAAYFARRDLYWTASATGVTSLKRLPGSCGAAWRGVIFAIRGAMLERIERLFGVGTKTAGTLRALLVGDSTRLDESDAESYRRSGVYHALVVSGLHLAAIGAMLLFFLRVARAGVSAALVSTVAVAWLYALICGMMAPVVRAAGGLTLYALGRWFYRRPKVMNLLAAVVLVYLIADPGQLFEASFQLSFFAVALIGGLAAPLLEATFGKLAGALKNIAAPGNDWQHGPRLAEWRVELRLWAEAVAGATRVPVALWLGLMAFAARVVNWLGESSIVALAVQLGMALPMVTYFHRFPLTSLSANLTVAPLLTAAVPVGLVAVITGWRWVAVPVGWAVQRAQSIADWHAGAEKALAGAYGRVPAPPVWLGAAFAVAVVAMALAVRGRGRRTSLLRWAAVLAFVAALGALLVHPFTASLHNGQMELTAIDVGQGDSLLAVSPGGSTMLVDTGGFPSFGADKPPSFDMGEEVVSPYLWSRSIRHLDVVAVTHPDADHAGGINAILENFRPAELWMGGELSKETVALAQHLGVTVRRPRAGESFDWDGAAIEVLSPPPGDEGGKVNNRSLVLRLSFGRHSFLLTGDVEKGGEYRMLGEGTLKPVTVLKVAHHGSKTSSTAEFLDAVKPTVALISVGRDNTYGHPNGDVVDRIGHSGARQVLRTDQLGQVSFFTDGRYLETENWAETEAAGYHAPAGP